MSFTLVFRAISLFLTPTKPRNTSQQETAKKLLPIRSMIITPIGDNIFSPTVSLSLSHQEPTQTPHSHPRMLDTLPLHHYKPHDPKDPQSRTNLLAWLKYPGILKIVQLARSLQIEFISLPSEECTKKIKALSDTLMRNSRILAPSKAGPLACSITISTLYTGTQSQKSHLASPAYQKFLTGKGGADEPNLKPILSIVKTLVTNKDNWPNVPKYSISQIAWWKI